MARAKSSAVEKALEKARERQRELFDQASKVRESTTRVQQLGLPMAMGGKSDQMLMPGFDVGGILDPSRTWKPKR